jgi:hypothetical protein
VQRETTRARKDMQRIAQSFNVIAPPSSDYGITRLRSLQPGRISEA